MITCRGKTTGTKSIEEGKSRIGCGNLFAVAFILIWSAGTLMFDCVAGYGTVQQVRTTSFSVARGIVLESRVEINHDSDGDTYRPKIRYEFFVGDDRFEHDVVRYGEVSSTDGYAADFVRAHPVDSEIAVYYDPSDPQDAVVVKGLQGSDFFLPLFMMPFNLVMIGGWCYIFGALARRQRSAPGFNVADDGQLVRVKLHERSPLVIALVTLGVLCFVGIFAVGLVTGFHPSLPLMLVVWSTIIAISLGGGIWAFMQNVSGNHDLVLNRFRDHVVLPIFEDRKLPKTLRLRDIRQAIYSSHARKDSDGDILTEYRVAIEYGENEEVERIAVLYTSTEAKMLCDWLNEQWFGGGVSL